MNKDEIRKILALVRPGGQDDADPLLASAKKSAQTDPELARWFEEQQEFDRKFAKAVGGIPIPAGLQTRTMAAASERIRQQSLIRQRSLWPRRIGLAAAAIAVLAVLFSTLRGPFQPAVSLADFRGEMISFIKLTPPLELESRDLEQIQTWLSRTDAPAEVSIPPGLAALEPVGCRVLFFRGQKVTLVCFRRSGTKLAHLLVLDGLPLRNLLSDGAPVFAQEGEWMTAAWRTKGRIYVLAAQGDRALLERYLQRSSS
jgi:hypothetical protein